MSAEVAQVSALLEAGSLVRSYLRTQAIPAANIHTASMYINIYVYCIHISVYQYIYQDLTVYADQYATNAETLNFLSFLRPILFPCTAYFYVDISVWLFGCYSDRRAENNRETLKSMPRRRQSHAGNLGNANDKIACARPAGVLCICSS